MTPRLIHELWLVVTAASTLTIVGVALYLIVSFRRSSGRWFFLSLAILFIAVAVEQGCAQLKNYFHPAPPEDQMLGLIWLAGRTAETVIGAMVLGYLVFGKNGNRNAPVQDPPKETS